MLDKFAYWVSFPANRDKVIWSAVAVFLISLWFTGDWGPLP